MPSGDNQKFKIEISTEADLSGLNEAEAALKRTGAATNPMADGSQTAALDRQLALERERTQAMRQTADEAGRYADAQASAAVDLDKQRATDVERAKAMRDMRAQTEATGRGFEKMFNQGRMQAIAGEIRGLASEFGRFAGEFAKTDEGKEMLSGLSEEFQIFGKTASNITSDVAAGLAAGGPIGGVLGGLKGLVRSVGGEFIEAKRREAESTAEMERGVAATMERIRARKKEATDRAIEKQYNAELLKLREQGDELERIAQLRGAQADLEKAKDKLADTQARNAGVPQDNIDIENVGQQLDRDRQANAEGLETARAKLEIAAGELFAAGDRYAAVAKVKGTVLAEKSKEFADYQQELEEMAKADADFETLKQTIATKDEELVTSAQTVLAEKQGELTGKLTDEAESLKTGLETAIAEQGAKASNTAKQGLADLTKLLEDKKVTPEEVASLSKIMSRLETSQEAKDKVVGERIDSIITNADTFLNILQGMQLRLDDQGRKLQTLQATQGTVRRDAW